MFRPTIFLASAAESIPVVTAIQGGLQRFASVIPWQHSFAASALTIPSIDGNLSKCDFGVFVVDPIDLTMSRDKELAIARDNVIFELGMFVGRLGLERSFIVKRRGDNLHLPSDLNGVNVVERDPDTTNGLPASVATACAELTDAMIKLGYSAQGLAPVQNLVVAYQHAEKIADESARVQHMNALFTEMKAIFAKRNPKNPIAKSIFLREDNYDFLIALAAGVSATPEASNVDRILSIPPARIVGGNPQHKFCEAVERLFASGFHTAKRKDLVEWLERFENLERNLPARIHKLKALL